MYIDIIKFQKRNESSAGLMSSRSSIATELDNESVAMEMSVDDLGMDDRIMGDSSEGDMIIPDDMKK